jgi:iron complex outermembrane receptor protein
MRTAVVMLAGLVAASAALGAEESARDLADLSLEEIGNIQITSVSRQAERLSVAAASIFVITGEDIRRAGATSLPEALRLAPNLQVARVNARSYAVSARGFNNAIGNKLLVLIDGRTVYTPLFSGVFWDQQDVLLDDVERIEVISGPGATLWGSNAVNGVINVITRRASSTQGVLATAGGGNRETGYGMRYGGRLADGAYRIYGQYVERNRSARMNGAPVMDGWEKGQAGFRADWGSASRGLTVQGDLYGGSADANAAGTPSISGANLLARWTGQYQDGSDLRVQAYYDRSERTDPGLWSDDMEIVDVEFQHGLPMGERHKLLWGAGYRQAHDQVQNSALIAFIPAARTLRWANLFVQDEFRVTEAVRFTAGAKLESNVYTGWEFLPSARLAWKPDDRQLVWGALSRAVRAPARLDRDFHFPGNAPYLINGGPNFQSEVSNVAEIGYRSQSSKAFSYSITAFRHFHDKLRSGQPAPANVENMIEGETTGAEMWANYQAGRNWRLSGGLTTLSQRLRLKSGSTDPVGPSALGNDPDYQWLLRTSFDLSPSHEADIQVRRVSALPNPAVPGYTAVDARLGWRASRELDVSVTLQNAFDPRHAEFDPAATRSELGRSVFLKFLWRT